MTTKIKTAKVRVESVAGFCCYGVAKALNGRKIAVTKDYPYGFSSNAYDAAVALAEAKGYVVENKQ